MVVRCGLTVWPSHDHGWAAAWQLCCAACGEIGSPFGLRLLVTPVASGEQLLVVIVKVKATDLKI